MDMGQLSLLLLLLLLLLLMTMKMGVTPPSPLVRTLGPPPVVALSAGGTGRPQLGTTVDDEWAVFTLTRTKSM